MTSGDFEIEVKRKIKNSTELNSMEKQFILEKIVHSNLMEQKIKFEAHYRPGDS